jgi:hypothetical protein
VRSLEFSEFYGLKSWCAAYNARTTCGQSCENRLDIIRVGSDAREYPPIAAARPLHLDCFQRTQQRSDVPRTLARTVMVELRKCGEQYGFAIEQLFEGR